MHDQLIVREFQDRARLQRQSRAAAWSLTATRVRSWSSYAKAGAADHARSRASTQHKRTRDRAREVAAPYGHTAWVVREQVVKIELELAGASFEVGPGGCVLVEESAALKHFEVGCDLPTDPAWRSATAATARRCATRWQAFDSDTRSGWASDDPSQGPRCRYGIRCRRAKRDRAALSAIVVQGEAVVVPARCVHRQLEGLLE